MLNIDVNYNPFFISCEIITKNSFQYFYSSYQQNAENEEQCQFAVQMNESLVKILNNINMNMYVNKNKLTTLNHLTIFSAAFRNTIIGMNVLSNDSFVEELKQMTESCLKFFNQVRRKEQIPDVLKYCLTDHTVPTKILSLLNFIIPNSGYFAS